MQCGAAQADRTWTLRWDLSKDTLASQPAAMAVPCCRRCGLARVWTRAWLLALVLGPTAVLAWYDVPLAPRYLSSYSLADPRARLVILVSMPVFLLLPFFWPGRPAMAMSLGGQWLFSFRSADYALSFEWANRERVVPEPPPPT